MELYKAIMNIKKAVADYPIQYALADPNATPSAQSSALRR
jgi:hypothetical protein